VSHYITRKTGIHQPQRRLPADWIARAAYVDSRTMDEASRSIMATVATENPVLVYDWTNGRTMQEVLVATGAELPTWTPMLDSHIAYSLETLGSVTDYRRSGSTILGRLVFAEDEEVEPVWRRVVAGHLRAVSVGGRRIAYTDIEPRQSAQVVGRRWTAGQYPLRITTQWAIRETSLVVFGADG
jgi:hypothetical protein